MEINKHRNCTEAKLENRRVIVGAMAEKDNVFIQYKKLTTKEDAQIPSSKHEVVGNRIKLTTINLSIEAANATLISLCIELGYDISSLTKK